MYEIHNLSSNAMIAQGALRRTGRRGATTRVPANVRWWRRNDLRTRSTNETH